MPTYKRLPDDCIDYCEAALDAVPNCHFTMVGENDGSVQNEIVRRGLSDYFTFVGWQSNVYDCMRHFDAFGYLMRSDTTGSMDNSVLEAMAAGLPVIISHEPIGHWIVQNGTTGVTVSTPRENAEALRRLFGDEAERRKLGQAAREYVISYCNADENLQRFNAAVTEV
jgi:glycosyltransferase involved in cell wall biosynthesis